MEPRAPEEIHIADSSIAISTFETATGYSLCSRKIALMPILHCAAQPSHDKAEEIPLLDFEVNALGTANLLEAMRQYLSRSARLIFHEHQQSVWRRSQRKAAERIRDTLRIRRSADWEGIDESAALIARRIRFSALPKLPRMFLRRNTDDISASNVGVFRGGCLTGPNHSGVQLHGFLSYLVKVALAGETYTVFGYKGKQVRDNIHSFDVVRAAEEFFRNPRPGEVYNIGGGRENSVSILEAFEQIEQMTGKKVQWKYHDESAQGRSHLLYQRPSETALTLSQLDADVQSGKNSPGNPASAREARWVRAGDLV